uniref:Metaxin glutathione S-transferase domain-containing protein n=1 Tax=Plectus sambesii TaxID=2011161 RepID=A0A914VPC1_9BILA
LQVLEEVERCCRSLSSKLGTNLYFFGESPTELDALVFGHLYTILTTELPDGELANIVKRHQNLVDFCKRIDLEYFMRSQ